MQLDGQLTTTKYLRLLPSFRILELILQHFSAMRVASRNGHTEVLKLLFQDPRTPEQYEIEGLRLQRDCEGSLQSLLWFLYKGFSLIGILMII